MPLNISHSNSRPKFNRPKLQQSGEILVRGYVDQTGQKWVRVGFQGKWAFAPRAELVSTSSAFFQRLERQDVAILDPKLQASIRTQAQDAAYKKKAYVVDRLGWHGDNYIQPDTPLPKFIASVRVIDDRKVSQADWGTGGSPKEWRAGIKRFVAGQALPTFVLGCAFASLIAHLLPEIDENVGFNLSDESSIGKSKLLLLAATVFGRPRRFRRTWHTTVNALEKTFALRGDSLFTLDELNLFLDSEPDANKKVGLAVHQLAAGSEKARYDDPGQRDHRCVFLSSSNSPIAEVVKAIGRNRVEAVEVRMPSIPADAGVGLGVFDHLPAGCSDTAQAIGKLSLFVDAQYGWAGPEFIRQMEKCFASTFSRKRLQARIRRLMAEFQQHAGTPTNDGQANRVVDKFALVFAALWLARRWKIVPLPFPGLAVLKVYRRYLSALPARMPVSTATYSALNTVREYVDARQSELRDLSDGRYPKLTDQQLDEAAGFLRRKGGVTWLLIRARRWNAEFVLRAKTMLEELMSLGRLKATDGCQTQVRVRKSRNKDRVYMIKIS